MHGNLSAVQKRNNQSKEAIANASEALRLNPKYLKVRIRRAELYEETDSPHESLEDWKEILEQDPSNKNAKKGKKILRVVPKGRIILRTIKFFIKLFSNLDLALIRLPPLVEAKNEKMKAEMMEGMKKLGNFCLKPFGLSTDNFKLEQNEGGSYNIKFQQ